MQEESSFGTDSRCVLANQPQQEEERIHRLGTTPETRNCALCTETLPIFKFPALINCEHKPQVCADCYNSWIVSELDSKSGKEIRCPESGCEVVLKHSEVQQYAVPEVYAKYVNAPLGKCVFVVHLKG